MRNPVTLIAAAFCLLLGVGLTHAQQEGFANATPPTNAAIYTTEWMQLLLDRVEFENRNVPQAARIYGYSAVALYTALAGGFEQPLDFSAILNEFPELPAADPALEYDWVTVMNGTMTTVLPVLMSPQDGRGRADTMTNFNTAPSNATRQAISRLSQNQYGDRAQQFEATALVRSLEHGQAIGDALIDWINADGFNETRAMTSAYQPPVGAGMWEQTTAGQYAMEPYWGMLRPFALDDADQCAVELDVPFDSDLDSTFHQQALEVRDMSRVLTDEQREIAAFWDERVGETGTASGHWVFVQNSLVDTLDLTLQDAATLYAVVNIGMADAFISTWSLKYQDNLLRPETYIQQYIDPTWRSYRQTPPFPAYPSGHAVLGGAVAELMTYQLGTIAYADRWGLQYGMRVRNYTSFHAAAYENALSRLYAGVHWRVDMENGLRQGRCVGEALIARLES